MSAAYENLRPLGRISYFNDIDLNSVAFLQRLGLDPFIGREHRLGILAVGADADRNTAGSRLDARYNAGEYLVLFGGKLLIHDAALGLADALDDHLLCSLSRNASEFFSLNRDLYGIAKLCALGDFLCGLKVYLERRLLDLLDGDLVYIHFNALSILIKQNIDIIRALGIIAPECSKHGLLYFIIHVFSGYSLFFFKIFDCREKFSIHFQFTSSLLYGYMQLDLRNLFLFKLNTRDGDISVIVFLERSN